MNLPNAVGMEPKPTEIVALTVSVAVSITATAGSSGGASSVT